MTAPLQSCWKSGVLLATLGSALGATFLLVGAGMLLPSPAGLLLSLFVPLPLFVAGLGWGRGCAILGGALFAGLMACLVQAGPGAVSPVSVFERVALWYSLPAGALISCALIRPHGQKGWASSCTLASCLTVVGYGAVAYTALSGSVVAQLESMVADVAHSLPARDAGPIEPILALLPPFFPSLLAIGLMGVLAVNGALAQCLLVKSGRALRPSPALLDLEVPPVFLSVLATTGVLGYAFFDQLGGQIAANLAMVTLVPYFLMGLAITRAGISYILSNALVAAGGVRARGGGTHSHSSRAVCSCGRSVLYSFIVTSTFVLLAVTMLGIFEPWLNLRNKLLQKK